MEGEEISCPKCDSKDLTLTGETNLYTCNNCNHTFTTVFISYGHDEHSNLAFKIEEDLRSEGIITWIDKSELHAGREWETKIENGLLGTQVVILMLTPHSVGREDGFCLNELSMASQLGRKIVPIMVRDVIPPLSIHRIQWLDFREWPNIGEETYKKKFAEILDILRGKPLSLDGRYSRLLNLLKPLDFGAEIEKYTKNFYGREWMFEKIDNWIKNDPQSKVFLLIGNPGVGKTAISAMLCHKYHDCAVYHLTKYNDARKSDALECILSLAFQLATRLPKYADKLLCINLERIRSKDVENRELKINSLFDEIIVQPLRELPKPSENILIIIDAIDEGTKGSKNELINLIASQFNLTPQWLKLFITTRPIQRIENTLSAFDPVRLKAEEERNIQDIKGYLNISLADLFKETDITEAVEVILNKSEGIFLYAQQVITEIKEKHLNLENVGDFPQGLRGIYQMFFERQFPNRDKYDNYQRPLLSIISAAYEPLDVELIKKILGDNNHRKFKQRIEPMGSLLEIEDGFVKPFHKSIVEWVRNEETEVDFYIDPEEGHQIILKYGWSLYESDYSTLPSYFLAYLPSHLHILKKLDRLSNILTDVKYFEICHEVGVEGIYKLMKTISEISTSKDMPLRNIILASLEGLVPFQFESEEGVNIAGRSAYINSVAQMFLIELNSEFKFSYGKFRTGSCWLFTVGQFSEGIFTISYDKTISTRQILNNYSYEVSQTEEKSLARKLEKIKIDQKKLTESLDWEVLLRLILSRLDCIEAISIITREGLPKYCHNRTKNFNINEDTQAALVSSLLNSWEKNMSGFGFVDFEYSIIAGDNIHVLLLPCGANYIMSVIIKDAIEFYRHLSQYICYFKKVASLIHNTYL